MKKLQYGLMFFGLATSIMAVIFNWGQGFQFVIWPITAAIWILNSLIIQKTLDRIENELNRKLPTTSISETKS